MFELHPELKKNLLPLGKTKLSLWFLHPNSETPWIILVPERPGTVEWTDLAQVDQKILSDEIHRGGKILTELFAPDKVNIGALGNRVPQFHFHIIARYKKDPAWPDPIWGRTLASDPVTITGWQKKISDALNFKAIDKMD